MGKRKLFITALMIGGTWVCLQRRLGRRVFLEERDRPVPNRDPVQRAVVLESRVTLRRNYQKTT